MENFIFCALYIDKTVTYLLFSFLPKFKMREIQRT